MKEWHRDATSDWEDFAKRMKPKLEADGVVPATRGTKLVPNLALEGQMSKTPSREKRHALAKTTPLTALNAEFEVVLRLIDASRTRAVASVNTELIELYWSIGEHISRKIAAEE